MSGESNVIGEARQLLDSLYANGDLSVDQHAGIAAGLARAAELIRERDRYRDNNTLAAQAYLQLESQLGQAHVEITRLEEALRQVARMKTIRGARAIVADALKEDTRQTDVDTTAERIRLRGFEG